jgi:hypothetical protein
MVSHPWLHSVLCDERLTHELGDAEARVLVEWVVERVERLAETHAGEEGEREVHCLLLRARAIARFVRLWCLEGAQGAAAQLAACERFGWPFPAPWADPCQLMQDIVGWEESFSG